MYALDLTHCVSVLINGIVPPLIFGGSKEMREALLWYNTGDASKECQRVMQKSFA